MEDAPPPVDFDPLLHSAPRLKIMMLLAATDVGVFNDLARDAALTPGNLASHLKGLEEAAYVETAHALIELKPRKRYRLTPKGRDALRAYMRSLESALLRLRELTDDGETLPS